MDPWVRVWDWAEQNAVQLQSLHVFSIRAPRSDFFLCLTSSSLPVQWHYWNETRY